MEETLQKPYPTDYNLLIAQDLWQSHYQTLLITLLKEYIKSNLLKNTMTKNVKLVELNTKVATAFFYVVYVVGRIIKKGLMKT